MSPRRAAAALLVPTVLLLAACTASENPTPLAQATVQVYSPIVASVLAPPIAAPSTDGKTHLAYELRLSNALDQSVGLSQLVVLGDGVPLQTLAGAALSSRTMATGGRIGADTLFGGTSAMVMLDVIVDDGAIPAVITHQLTIAPATPHPPVFSSPMTETIAPVVVDKSAPVTIGSPVRGSNWLNGNSCCDITPHRTAINPINGSYWVPERFAIDFVQLDSENRIFHGPITDLASYAYEGADIVAVADGTIISMAWNLAETRPGAHPEGLTLLEYGGNFVVQDIGNSRFAFYAHLKPDNPQHLAVGQKVKKGEVIGTLGNSGNSDMPHLHFHIMDSPLPLASNGLPFLID